MSVVEEAMKKAAVAWISVGGAPATAVWCLWLDGALYVVSGPGEQPAPGLAEAATGAGVPVAVSARGDHGGRIVTWPATASRVEPDSADWQAVAPQLAAKRLNSPGGAEETIARWAAGGTIARLVPAGEPVEEGPSLSDASEAAPPRPTPAAAVTRRPFRLHRVRRR